MILTVRPVPVEYCAQTWPLVEKFIESAYSIGYTEYTLDQAKLMVCTGMWSLLVAVDEGENIHGAATVQFLNYPNNRVAYVTAIGGKLMISKDTVEQLSEYARRNGATRIHGGARPSVARLWRKFGYKEISTTVGLEL